MSEEILKRLTEIERLLKTPGGGTRPTESDGKVRLQKCTQEEFERLPAMMSAREFMDWTGYNKDELGDEVRAGRIAVYRPKGHTKARYYKAEIARLGGWKM